MGDDEQGKGNDNGDGPDEGGSILDDGGVDTDERAGRSLGIQPDKEPDDETKQDMDEERERRLDPDNRPDDVEIDNTQRTFDTDRGMFTDNDDYDENADPPYSDPENPNNDDNDDSADDSDDSDDSTGADETEPKDEPQEEQDEEQRAEADS